MSLQNKLLSGSKADRRWPACGAIGLGFTQPMEPPSVSFQPGAAGSLGIRQSLDPPVRSAG
ncbi:MAG: hypothetical protein ACPHN2_16000 [Sinimarinibacterium flocculans]|uniref:hypothetical protein n=1 Tax=Sinimarinibacterium flocculans TaxID=985250 RepID=UPI003C46EBE9